MYQSESGRKNVIRSLPAPVPYGLLQRQPVFRGRTPADAEHGEDNQPRAAMDSLSVHEVPSIVPQALLSPGQLLDGATRAFMESRFEHDFSMVRVHTDAAAVASTRAVNALAYTVGSDIVFGADQYAPHKSAGRRLLAHELTHVVQQRSYPDPRARLQMGAVDDPYERQASQVADLLTSGQSLPALSPTSPLVQRQEAGTATGQPNAAGTSAASGAICSQQDIDNVRSEALNWLDDIYEQLLSYDVNEIFAQAGTSDSSDQQRIGAALQQAFNTKDLAYVQVIRRRFLHMANMLREAGRVTIHCGGPGCRGAGSSFTAAYVDRPYALVLCSPGTPGRRPIATFIHELGHAVLPQVGIRNRVQPNGGIRDRAYTSERVFQDLSPQETLDNAASYGLLADLLHSRANRQVVTHQADTTPGCAQSAPVLHAFARAEMWNRFAYSTLADYVNFLGNDPISTLPSEYRDPLMRSFPSLTTPGLRSLRDGYQSLHDRGFNLQWDFACISRSSRCTAGGLGFASSGTATASSISIVAIQTAHTIHLCPAWFSASEDDQIRSIYALFLIGRPSWIVANFELPRTYAYVDLAREIALGRAPRPTTRNAIEHELQDRPTAPLPVQRPAGNPGPQRP